MALSRFFTLDEMTRSETARREGIPNEPGATEVGRLQALCAAVLDPLRESIGQPVKVNSGYRSPDLNRHIRGAEDSQHVQGMAADLQAPGLRVLELFQRIIQLGLPFDQLIYEAKDATTKWVHVSHNPARNRGEIRTAVFGANGRPLRYPIVTAAAALAMEEPAMRARGAGPVEMDYVEMDDAPTARRPAVKKKKKTVKRAKVKTAKAPKRKPVKIARVKTARRKVTARKAGAKPAARARSAAKRAASR
jgi:hypothetical protein